MAKFGLRKLQLALSKKEKKESHTKSKQKSHRRSGSKLRENVQKPSKKLKKGNKLDSLIKASMFRFLNEKLYTCSSHDALKYFEGDPMAFNIYHSGYQQQLAQWPQDPLNWVLEQLNSSASNESSKYIVVDMGCGDARLSLKLSQKFEVHSFDLVAVNQRVTVCDMAHTPLKNAEADFVVFCLSLMGTNCQDFICEANRILKLGGQMLIVEVASRFDNRFKDFLKKLKAYGFGNEFSETTQDTYFVRSRLKKLSDLWHKSRTGLPSLELHPCVYKKRLGQPKNCT